MSSQKIVITTLAKQELHRTSREVGIFFPHSDDNYTLASVIVQGKSLNFSDFRYLVYTLGSLDSVASNVPGLLKIFTSDVKKLDLFLLF